MSALTSSMVSSWSGVSANGNASSSSCCQGLSGPNAWPARRHAGGVELHELDGDVADGLAGAALRGGPVGAAHLRQLRRLAADVAGQQVELVGRHVELVARVAALGGRVLEQQELADDLLGGLVAHAARPRLLHGGDLPPGQLDEPPDAVRLVHDVVAGLQLQRVDDVLAAGGELLRPAVVHRRGAAVELALARRRRGTPPAARSRSRDRRSARRRRRARARTAAARRCVRRRRARRARRGRAPRAPCRPRSRPWTSRGGGGRRCGRAARRGGRASPVWRSP